MGRWMDGRMNWWMKDQLLLFLLHEIDLLGLIAPLVHHLLNLLLGLGAQTIAPEAKSTSRNAVMWKQ